MPNHEIMVNWGTHKIAPASPAGTVGKEIGAATAEGSTLVGLGAHAYRRSVQPSDGEVKPFSGDHGVYKPGQDRRVLKPRTDLPRSAPGVR